ncbi:MAG TPA: hypothetical protein VKF17_07735 [Isosphaeraceae bacterium]|nr:hypothetical protein [Isosphaeraceae bacterium]
MKWGLWCVVLAVVASTSVIVWMSRAQDFDPPPCLPDGFDSPVLAIELVRSAQDVSRILRDPESGKNRQVFRTQIFEDWFFIPSYSLVFLGLIIVGYRKTSFGTGLAFSAGVCVALAAACDVQENLAILRVVNNGRFDPSDASALAIRNPSMVKWAAIFAACALVAPPFLFRTPGGALTRWLARAVGASLAAASCVGFYALFKNPLIELATALIGLGFALAFVLSLMHLLRHRRPRGEAPA